jgi:hypothetical protein
VGAPVASRDFCFFFRTVFFNPGGAAAGVRDG